MDHAALIGLRNRLRGLAKLDTTGGYQAVRARLVELSPDPRDKSAMRLRFLQQVLPRDALNARLRGGQRLVFDLDELRGVRTPWGQLDLTRVNDLRSYYGCEHAMYALARDLELLHWLGALRLAYMRRSGTAAGVSPANMLAEGVGDLLIASGARGAAGPWLVREELVRDARKLRAKSNAPGQWTGSTPDGERVGIVHRGDGEFTVNGTPTESDDAQVAFLLAHPDVSCFSSAYPALPAALMRELRWGLLTLNREVAVELRADAETLAGGRWKSRAGQLFRFVPADPAAGRANPAFTIAGERTDPFDAQVRFLLAHEGVTHLASAAAALPRRLHNWDGLFAWLRPIGLTRDRAEALLAAVPRLAERGRTKVAGYQFELSDEQLSIDGEPAHAVVQRWVGQLVDRERLGVPGAAAAPAPPGLPRRKDFRTVRYESPDGQSWTVNSRQFMLLRRLERDGGWHKRRELQEMVALDSGEELLQADVAELVRNGALVVEGGTWNCRYAPSWRATLPETGGQRLPLREFELLEKLRAKGHEEFTVRRAAELLGVSRSSADRFLNGLTKRGLLTKTKVNAPQPHRFRLASE